LVLYIALMISIRDGPALRVLALIPYANFLLDRGYPADLQYIHDNLYNPNAIREPGRVIKNDLEEVGGGWWLGGFDLWEEVSVLARG
jgi:glucoamylase